MIDKFLAIGSTPDWIDPLKGIIEEFQHGSGDKVTFYRSVSIREAKRRLDKAGIKHWNDFVDGEYGVITVPKGKGEIAYEIISNG